MSYLDLYQSSIVQNAKEDENESDDEQTSAVAPVAPLQAHYQNYYLTSILAEQIVAALSTTQAIDMSYNAIDQLPRTASPMLIALDLSYNVIERPIVVSAGYQLLELNISNNRIADLKGIALLDSLEFLDVSSNALARLEGLENMKRLKVLKLQHNKISSFQSLRLLTYNVCLSDVRLEGNIIVEDPYFKVKLINYIPNLKYLDGAAVWRRTSLQSRVVNDDLQYSDLCARTPASVQKYAKLSKRSHSMQNMHDVHDLTGSMLTMQGLRSFNNQQASLATPMRGFNRPLPEQTPLPPGLTYFGVTDTDRSIKSSRNSPDRSLFRVPPAGVSTGESNSDINLLPAHLQAMLRKHMRAYASPRRSVHPLSSPPKKEDTAVGASYLQVNKPGKAHTRTNSQEETPRSRSALPWRNPPSVVPNLELGFKSRRNGGDADSVSTTAQGVDTSRNGSFNGGGNRANSVTRACQRMFNAAVFPSATPQGQKSTIMSVQTTMGASRGTANTPSVSAVTVLVPPQQNTSPMRASPMKTAPAGGATASARETDTQSTTTAASQWMNPDLNSAIKARTAAPFDSNLNQMESTMNSSLFVLQKSFDADHKRVRSDNGSVASSSAQQRGRPRARQDLQQTLTSESGARSLTSSNGHLRSVTPTKASIIRANFTTEMIRATQETESQARNLRENRTYSRPSSPTLHSPHQQRNPAYTYLQGTSSPTRRREELEGIPSYSVRTQPFSPQATPRGRSKSPFTKARGASPPRVSSTARVLDVYKDMPQDSQSQRHASRGKQRSSEKVPHYATSRYRQYSPEGPSTAPNAANAHQGNNQLRIKVPPRGSKHVPAQAHACAPAEHRAADPARRSPSKKPASRAYSDESKSSGPWAGAPPPPPPNAGDDSPYRRFLQLRERLSNKYVQSAAENGEFFEPVRSSSLDKHANVDTLIGRGGSNDREHESSIERAQSDSVQNDGRQYMDGVVETKGQEYPESQTEHVLSVAQPVPHDRLPVHMSQNFPPETPQDRLPPPPPPQELSFEELRDQYQRQYQLEYQKQRQEQENSAERGRSNSFGTPDGFLAPAPPNQPAATAAALSSSVASLPTGSVVAPPAVPPRSAGYEALSDLIHQRRSVLEKITQPRDLSPDKARHTSPGKERIGGAISHLKHRQEASVNVIQSVTRERTVPLPVHNGLLQVSLSTPALHPSINNYTSMAQAHQPDSVQSARDMMSNSFMNRLTSNNPYMTSGDLLNRSSTGGVQGENSTSPPPPLPMSTPAVSAPEMGARFQGVTNLMGSYPAPPPYVPHGPPSPAASSSSILSQPVPAGSASYPQMVRSAEGVPAVAPVSVISAGPLMPASGGLAQAIRDLQAKQARDISALKRQ